MNWIITSLLMVIGSVTLYLTVRKASILKLPSQFNNLAIFVLPLIIYALIGCSRGLSYSISLTNFLIIFVASLFFSYISSVTSLKSIELAPNPGYSLVISKSYVVFTTIFSYLFLGGDFTPIKVIAILLIVAFSALIAIDPSKTKDVANNHWLAYTMYSFFGWGMLSLSIKYLATQGVVTIVTLTYMYVFVSLFIVIETLLKKIKIVLNMQNMKYFVLLGIFSAVFNYYNFYSVSIAPNVGYVNAINASSISMVTIFSIFLFKDEFSLRKLFGVFGVTAGLLLLIL